jgi:hypothetical protein
MRPNQRLSRSLYVQTVRYDRTNFSTLFDAADPERSIEQRNASTVAPQALFLLNHPFVWTQAEQLARRLHREVPDSEQGRIERAFQLLYGRPPTPTEVRIGLGFLHRAAPGTGAWPDLLHLLMCGNEFVYID